MGAWDVRGQLLPQLLLSPFLGVAVLLFLNIGSFVHARNFTFTYVRDDVAALRILLKAWQDTPDLSHNLAGWQRTKNPDFCDYLLPNSTQATNSSSWQGVQCVWECVVDENNFCTEDPVLFVTSLSLSNASIVGVLPPEIGNFTALQTLELTGNPKLTGPLPRDLQSNGYLTVLDLHDNAFNGTLPDLEISTLLRLDLSGNQFTGFFPAGILLFSIEELSFSNNHFHGEIISNAFEGLTAVTILDLSHNNFNGTLPSLNDMKRLAHLDVSRNQFEGPLPDLRQFSRLSYVDFSRNRFTGTANFVDIFNLNTRTTLTFVDLSNNQLTGPLPSWNALSLVSIRELYLDNNNLTGTLDILNLLEQDLLQIRNTAWSATGKLVIMSLSNNSIEHVISNSYIIANVTTVFILAGNPYCDFDCNDDTHRYYCAQTCINTILAKGNKRKIIIIATTTSVAAIVLIVLIVVGCTLINNKRYKQYLQLQFEQKFLEFDVKPTIFSYNELRSATRDFHEDMKLGQGGYGAVYKGVLPSGHVVAVKQLFVQAAQGQDDFLNEVVLITGMKHRNLVNLKGCCRRDSQKLLVYEYVENFDVDQLLLGSRRQINGPLACWPARLKICLGVARGLHYLHALAHPKVIHRDIKAANILLDANLEPKIADFGLALLFPDEQTHIMTVHVAGTKGYLAPEYASLGQLSDKVDVYSFGVLCLEIISGRHNIEETAPLHQVYLTQWAWKLHEVDRLMELADPTLQISDEELRDVQRIINVCLQCISNVVDRRPSMARIVAILQGDVDSDVQVLGEGQLSSKGSQKSWSGLGSVSEEESSTSSLFGSHGKSRRGQSTRIDSCATVELSQIGGR